MKDRLGPKGKWTETIVPSIKTGQNMDGGTKNRMSSIKTGQIMDGGTTQTESIKNTGLMGS